MHKPVLNVPQHWTNELTAAHTVPSGDSASSRIQSVFGPPMYVANQKLAARGSSRATIPVVASRIDPLIGLPALSESPRPQYLHNRRCHQNGAWPSTERFPANKCHRSICPRRQSGAPHNPLMHGLFEHIGCSAPDVNPAFPSPWERRSLEGNTQTRLLPRQYRGLIEIGSAEICDWSRIPEV